MDVEDYLGGAPEPQRSTLSELRSTLRGLLPDATEALSYGVPAFVVAGKPVAGYAWAKRHCSYFPHSSVVLTELADLLEGHDWSKGTLRFPVDEPPDRELVARLVEVRLRQLAADEVTKRTRKNAAETTGAEDTGPRLLSGGNPQIPKGDGPDPVRAYIEAMPGWKRDVGRRLDALIERTVPEVERAVRWNSPFYGVDGRGWFLIYHCFTRYIKVTFFRGTSLDPVPPEGSKDPEARYVHLHEDEDLDEELLATWIGQASELPGWDGF